MNKADDQKIRGAAEAAGIKNPVIVADNTIHIPRDLELVEGKGITLKRKYPKVYANDPCTCGSGRKAKKCCYEPYKK